MWFKFPEGCSNISVEQQSFSIEVVDGDGRGYFRAPAHFAARILGTNMGFAADVIPPDGAPEDLPRADPLRDGAISELTGTNEALRMELGGMRSDLEAERAKVRALETARNNLNEKVRAQEELIANLKEQIEEK